MVKNTHTCFIIFFVCILSVMICSQGRTQDKNYPIKKGSKSLQFMINNNFTLDNFQGSLLSVKYHLTNKSALRFGIGFNLDDSDTEDESSSVLSDSLNLVNEQDLDYTITDFQFSILYLYYTDPNDDISFFIGAGPMVGVDHEKLNSTDDRTSGSQEYFNDESNKEGEKTTKFWNAGLLAVCGIEWFVRHNIGLHAEYGLKCYYSYLTQKSDESTAYPSSDYSMNLSAERKENQFSLKSESVKLGVSFYF